MSTIQETFLLADGTFNAKKLWTPLRDGLVRQGIPAGQVLIVDSSSDDGTRDLAAAEGFEVVRIDHCDFNHGGTRQAALDYVPWASIVVYLTQDAVLATPDSIEKLLTAFEDASASRLPFSRTVSPRTAWMHCAKLAAFPPR
jgi:rhamnosyltransferase